MVVSQLWVLPESILQMLTGGGLLGADTAGAKVTYDAYETWRRNDDEVKQN